MTHYVLMLVSDNVVVGQYIFSNSTDLLIFMQNNVKMFNDLGATAQIYNIQFDVHLTASYRQLKRDTND